MENKTTKKVTGASLRNEYQREWRAKHPGKATEQVNKYWAKKADEANQAIKEANNA